MAQRLTLRDTPVWMKRYVGGERRLSLALLDACMRRLGVTPLRPPPHHAGDRAKQLEMRRLGELRDADVSVPDVIGEGPGLLMLSDIGSSFSARLSQCRGDTVAIDALTSAAVDAIADVHARGQYLGQPTARNLVVLDHGGIGFLDFEEDPAEVMSLDNAQARDWLLFTHGVARHYAQRPEALSGILKHGLSRSRADVATIVTDSSDRLHVVARVLAPFGRSAARVRAALAALRLVSFAAVAFLAALAVDYLHDGDIDLLSWASHIIGTLS
ncbi:serine/threonine protein phosphatase [Dokdonella sp. MW10]|uniref:serine/threonine protein phosphatase n=1 Tax=Dokdonella sp. MW10 TaxID=2992926 RepID=UPI003F7E8AD9